MKRSFFAVVAVGILVFPQIGRSQESQVPEGMRVGSFELDVCVPEEALDFAISPELSEEGRYFHDPRNRVVIVRDFPERASQVKGSLESLGALYARALAKKEEVAAVSPREVGLEAGDPVQIHAALLLARRTPCSTAEATAGESEWFLPVEVVAMGLDTEDVEIFQFAQVDLAGLVVLQTSLPPENGERLSKTTIREYDVQLTLQGNQLRYSLQVPNPANGGGRCGANRSQVLSGQTNLGIGKTRILGTGVNSEGETILLVVRLDTVES
jgi:hypothetical protein